MSDVVLVSPILLKPSFEESVYDTPGEYTLEIPEGASAMQIVAWGGGGAGWGTIYGSAGFAYGGAGGAIECEIPLGPSTVEPGDSLALVVGYGYSGNTPGHGQGGDRDGARAQAGGGATGVFDASVSQGNAIAMAAGGGGCGHTGGGSRNSGYPADHVSHSGGNGTMEGTNAKSFGSAVTDQSGAGGGGYFGGPRTGGGTGGAGGASFIHANASSGTIHDHSTTTHVPNNTGHEGYNGTAGRGSTFRGEYVVDQDYGAPGLLIINFT